MTSCLRCGAPVHRAVEAGRSVTLDAHESAAGDARYRVIEYGSPWLVEPIDTAARSGYQDHRLTCPHVSARERLAATNRALGAG